MLGSLLRLFVLYLAFTVEVSVDAAVLEYPEGCRNQSTGTCAVTLMSKSAQKIEWPFVSVKARVGATLIVNEAASRLDLVSGDLFIEALDSTLLATEFLTAELPPLSRVLIERRQEYAWITAVQGVISLKPKGSRQTLNLPAGFRLRIAAVGESGEALAEIPQAAPWNPTVEAWGRLYVGTKVEFREELKNFFKVWQQATEQGSELSQELAFRHIASVHEQRRQQELRRKRRAAENQRLRALFRQKNYLEGP